MKRAAIVVTVALVALVGLSVPSYAAAPDRCVSRAEYRHVRHGTTAPRAHQIIGYNGKVAARFDEPGWHSMTREYRACGGGVVMLDMQRTTSDKPYRITAKYAVWS